MNASLPLYSVARAAEAPILNVFGTKVKVLAGADETGGESSLAVIICGPGDGAPLHRHAASESFFILRGELTVEVDGETTQLGAGDSIHVRPDAVHGFRNAGSAETEFLAMGAPAGHERFFVDADALIRSGQFNPETAQALCQRHEIELLEG